MKETIEKIKKFFNEKKQSWDSIYQYNGLPVIAISIDWGDWKHDHLCCKGLMKELGYTEISHEVTEEDGSDCYSAIHYFMEG